MEMIDRSLQLRYMTVAVFNHPLQIKLVLHYFAVLILPSIVFTLRLLVLILQQLI